MLAIFQNAGYMGLYGGLDVEKTFSFFAIDKPVEYAKLYLDGTIQIWVDAENTLYL